MKICIIDDDPLLLDHVAGLLTGLGQEVTTAPDADTGLKRIESQGSDAVVVDILMPDRDGLTLIMELRETRQDIRIVAISGGGRIGAGAVLSMAKALGADACLIKPVSATDLSEALRL